MDPHHDHLARVGIGQVMGDHVPFRTVATVHSSEVLQQGGPVLG